MRIIPRRPAIIGIIGVAVIAAVVATVAVVNARSEDPATDEAWPPVRTLPSGSVFPAIEGSLYHCFGQMPLKHEWLVHTDMYFGDTQAETLVIDQRPIAWIEEYYGHPVDTGTRKSMYSLDWIEEYLGHPLPDGYFLWAGHACILNFLDAPPEIMDQILATTAEDGEVTATWSDFQITWTNNGIDGPDAIVSYFRPES